MSRNIHLDRICKELKKGRRRNGSAASSRQKGLVIIYLLDSLESSGNQPHKQSANRTAMQCGNCKNIRVVELLHVNKMALNIVRSLGRDVTVRWWGTNEIEFEDEAT